MAEKPKKGAGADASPTVLVRFRADWFETLPADWAPPALAETLILDPEVELTVWAVSVPMVNKGAEGDIVVEMTDFKGINGSHYRGSMERALARGAEDGRS